MVGSDEVMRVSSVIAPFLIGTLKSTRMKTRLPRRSRSLIEYFVIADQAGLKPASTASSAGRRSGSSSPTRCRTTPSPSRSRRP